MKRYILLATFFSSIFFRGAIAQENSSTDNLVVRLHILAPGVAVEKSVVSDFTILYDITLGFSYNYIKVNGSSASTLVFFPSMKIEPRYYIDMQTRKLNGKRTDHFSASYFSGLLQAGIPTKEVDNWYNCGVIFGIQRSFWESCYVDIGVGVGALTYGSNTNANYMGSFALGIIMNKK
jgi:hypothetical protein